MLGCEEQIGWFGIDPFHKEWIIKPATKKNVVVFLPMIHWKKIIDKLERTSLFSSQKYQVASFQFPLRIIVPTTVAGSYEVPSIATKIRFSEITLYLSPLPPLVSTWHTPWFPSILRRLVLASTAMAFSRVVAKSRPEKQSTAVR